MVWKMPANTTCYNNANEVGSLACTLLELLELWRLTWAEH